MKKELFWAAFCRPSKPAEIIFKPQQGYIKSYKTEYGKISFGLYKNLAGWISPQERAKPLNGVNSSQRAKAGIEKPANAAKGGD